MLIDFSSLRNSKKVQDAQHFALYLFLNFPAKTLKTLQKFSCVFLWHFYALKAWKSNNFHNIKFLQNSTFSPFFCSLNIFQPIPSFPKKFVSSKCCITKEKCFLERIVPNICGQPNVVYKLINLFAENLLSLPQKKSFCLQNFS